jgi:inner membrane protein
MPWWGWVVIGAVLLIAEVVIGTDFWLVFFGAAAILVGLLGAAGVHLPEWGQWLIFGAGSIVALLLFRNRLRARFRRQGDPSPVTPSDLVGASGVAREPLAPGARGSAEIRGTTWKIRNRGPRELAPGDRFRIDAVDGLTLDGRRED